MCCGVVWILPINGLSPSEKMYCCRIFSLFNSFAAPDTHTMTVNVARCYTNIIAMWFETELIQFCRWIWQVVRRPSSGSRTEIELNWHKQISTISLSSLSAVGTQLLYTKSHFSTEQSGGGEEMVDVWGEPNAKHYIVSCVWLCVDCRMHMLHTHNSVLLWFTSTARNSSDSMKRSWLDLARDTDSYQTNRNDSVFVLSLTPDINEQSNNRTLTHIFASIPISEITEAREQRAKLPIKIEFVSESCLRMIWMTFEDDSHDFAIRKKNGK